MRVFSYLRYSSLNQKGGVSLELQREAIAQFIESNSSWAGQQPIERRDEAKTGTTFAGRVGFGSILSDAARGDVVIVYKYDRLGRNLLESLQNLNHLEQIAGIAVYSATEPNTEVVRNLLLTMAQEYSRQLSDRCKRALDSLAAAGYTTNKPPYGYRLEKNGRRTGAKFVVVPEQAEVVRRMFKMRLDGHSLREIARTLNDCNIATPRKKMWTVSGMHAMLRNEAYLGTVTSGVRIFKKGRRGPGNGKKRPKSEWVVRQNAHEPIVTREMWDAVRAVEAANPGHAKRPQSRATHLWTGFLKCASCGANLTRQSVSRGTWYGCDSHRRFGVQLPCHNRYLVREETISMTMIKVLKDQVYGADWIDEVVRIVRHEVKAATSSTEDLLRPMQVGLKRLSGQIEGAERRLVHVPEDSLPVFLDELKRLKKERDEMQSRIDSVKKMAGGAIDLDGLEVKIRGRLENLWKALEGKDAAQARLELEKHIEKVVVKSNKEAILYAKPGGILAGLELPIPLQAQSATEVAAEDGTCMGSVHIPSRMRTLRSLTVRATLRPLLLALPF